MTSIDISIPAIAAIPVSAIPLSALTSHERDAAAATFSAAVARLRRTGWTKGTYGYSGGPNCLAGALAFEGGTMATAGLLTSFLGGTRIEHWNDNICPDAATAIAVLEGAAAWARPARMGDIGVQEEQVELEPLPAEAPVAEPSPEVVPAPVAEPVPA